MNDFRVMLWKELVQVSNRARFASQKSLAAAALGTIFMGAAYTQMYHGPLAGSYEAAPSFARLFFLLATAALALALPLAAMGLAAGIVVHERTQRRLGLLLLTPLSAGAIVGSKAASVAARVAMAMVISLPMFAILPLFGGVDGETVLMAAVLVAGNVCLYAAIGTAASVVSRRFLSALVLAAAIAALWNLALLAAGWYIRYLNWGWLSALCQHARSLSPLNIYYLFAMGRIGGSSLAYHTCANLVLAGAFLVAAFPLLRRIDAGSLETTRRARRFRFLLPRRRERRGREATTLSAWVEPGVISKELSSSRFVSSLPAILWYAVVWGMVGAVWVASRGTVNPLGPGVLWGTLTAEAIGFFFILSASASIRVVIEREALTLQTLAVTRLGAWRILAGKGTVALIEQLPGLWILFIHLTFVLFATETALSQVVFTGAALVVCAVYSTVFGIFLSSIARRTSQALLTTAVMWFAGPYIVLGPAILLGSRFEGVGDADVYFALLAAAPLAAAAAALMLVLSRKRALGTANLVMGYSIIPALAWALILYTVGAHESLGADYMIFLPAATVVNWTYTIREIPAGILVLPVQAAACLWLAAAGVAGFEAEARKG